MPSAWITEDPAGTGTALTGQRDKDRKADGGSRSAVDPGAVARVVWLEGVFVGGEGAGGYFCGVGGGCGGEDAA